MPTDQRSFDISVERAMRDFRIGPDLLGELRALGLPAVRDGGQWLFNGTDLWNLAVDLIGSSPQRKVVVWWAREIARQAREPGCYTIDYVVRCPEPERDHSCVFSFLSPSGRRVTRRGRPAGTASMYQATFCAANSWPPLPQPAADLIAEFSDIEFLRLPEPFRWDTNFIMTQRLADCAGMARLFANEGKRRGIQVRFCYGRSFFPPLSGGHYWTEFRSGSAWIPVDPIMMHAMTRWGLLERDRWDRHGSAIGMTLGRLAGAQLPVAIHDGMIVDVQMPVRRGLSAGAAGQA